MTINISTLFTPATQQQWLGQIIANAQLLGLNATGWQSGGVARTILSILSNVLAVSDGVISTMGQGGFLDSAATVTADPSLPPYTTGTAWTAGWLDLLAQGVYNVQRSPATFASGSITITCAATTSPATLAPFTFHVANPAANGPTYVNTTAITLAPNTPTTGTFQADAAGPLGNSFAGAITQTVTSIIGVSVSNPGAFNGIAAQSNASLVTACRLKLQSLSPNGSVGAYDYFARQAIVLLAAQTPSISMVAPVTRTSVIVSTQLGIVDLYVATSTGAVPGISAFPLSSVFNNGFGGITVSAPAHGLTTNSYVTISGVNGVPGANGTFQINVLNVNQFGLNNAQFTGAYISGGVIDGGDLGQVNQIIQANAVPDAVTARTHAATVANLAVVVSVWVPAVQVASTQFAVSTALSNYLSNVPIGGLTDPGGFYTNAVPFDSILGAVYQATLATGLPLLVKQATMTVNGNNGGYILLATTDVPVLSPAAVISIHGV